MLVSDIDRDVTCTRTRISDLRLISAAIIHPCHGTTDWVAAVPISHAAYRCHSGFLVVRVGLHFVFGAIDITSLQVLIPNYVICPRNFMPPEFNASHNANLSHSVLNNVYLEFPIVVIFMSTCFNPD